MTHFVISSSSNLFEESSSWSPWRSGSFLHFPGHPKAAFSWIPIPLLPLPSFIVTKLAAAPQQSLAWKNRQHQPPTSPQRHSAQPHVWCSDALAADVLSSITYVRTFQNCGAIPGRKSDQSPASLGAFLGSPFLDAGYITWLVHQSPIVIYSFWTLLSPLQTTSFFDPSGCLWLVNSDKVPALPQSNYCTRRETSRPLFLFLRSVWSW